MDDNRPELIGTSDEINCETLSYSEKRSLIFHLLYSIDRFDYEASLESIVDNFEKGYNIIIPEYSQVYKETQAIINQREALDDDIKPLLVNWKWDRVGLVTKLILRIAIWELLNTSIDHKLIINEAIELAKCFAEKDSFKFVNGILDKFLKENKK